MISINSLNIYQQIHIGILTTEYITVQAAAEVTGYNIQYLRRLLRSGTLEGVKIGQMWLTELDALDQDSGIHHRLFIAAISMKYLPVVVFILATIAVGNRIRD